MDKVCYLLSPLCLPYPAQLRPLPQRGGSDSSRPAEGAGPHLAAGRPRRASSCRSSPLPCLFPLRRSREGGGGRWRRRWQWRWQLSRPAGWCDRSARAAQRPRFVQPGGTERRPRPEPARAEEGGGGGGQGGPWEAARGPGIAAGSWPCRPRRSEPRPWRPARSGSRRRST